MKYVHLLALSILLVLANACNKPGSSQEPEVVQDTTFAPVKGKLVVYQMMTRLFGNKETHNKPYGTIHENGCGKFEDVNEAALKGIKDLGVTHVWYTGVLDHATMTAFPDANLPADDADVVKGRAGSPYAIKDYYDVTPLLAANPNNRMTEFVQLIERTHAAGLAVLIDFVPNHVARNYRSDARPSNVSDLGETDSPSKGFSTSNNFYYLQGTKFNVPKDCNPLGAEKAPGEDGQYAEAPARATGNNVFNASPSNGDWFETIKLNYGVEYTEAGEVKHFDPQPETWAKMRDILLFWAGKGVDGFRCDMAEMVPVEFWAWAIPEVKKQFPKVVFIAEIYNPGIYHAYVQQGKFDYLYDKVGVYDALRALMTGKGKVAQIDSALKKIEGIEGNMLRFLENHDEQRIASKDFAGDAWAAIPAMTLSATLGSGPVMLYFGQEVGEPGKGLEGFQGEDGRSTIFDFWGVPEHQKWMNNGKFDGGQLDSSQKALRKFYQDLLNLSVSEEALREGKLQVLPSPWEGVYAYVRYTNAQQVLVVVNFDRKMVCDKPLVVTAQNLAAIGLPMGTAFSLQPLMGPDGGAGKEISTGDWVGAGLPLNLPPNSAFVWKLARK